MSYVSSAIICSVAALEANINQFLIDHKAKLNDISVNKDSIIFSKYSRLKDDKGILEQIFTVPTVMLKYDVVSFMLKEKLITQNKLKEDTMYLIDLRNALVHFTPEWDNDLKKHKDLEISKKNRFTYSPFYDKDIFFIPHRCLSGSCATWSHATASDFIKMFKSTYIS